MKNPLLIVPVLVVAAAASAGAAGMCKLTPYEKSPKGLPNSESKISDCAQVDALPAEEQQLFREVRAAINGLKEDAEAIPPVLEKPEAKKFLSKGELYLINKIKISKGLGDLMNG